MKLISFRLFMIPIFRILVHDTTIFVSMILFFSYPWNNLIRINDTNFSVSMILTILYPWNRFLRIPNFKAAHTRSIFCAKSLSISLIVNHIDRVWAILKTCAKVLSKSSSAWYFLRKPQSLRNYWPCMATTWFLCKLT